MRCRRMKNDGSPCRVHVIIKGEGCWRHRNDPRVVADFRVPNVVTAFKCPHCGHLTELTDLV